MTPSCSSQIWTALNSNTLVASLKKIKRPNNTQLQSYMCSSSSYCVVVLYSCCSHTNDQIHEPVCNVSYFISNGRRSDSRLFCWGKAASEKHQFCLGPFAFAPPTRLVSLTYLIIRYIRGEYDDKQISTLQASYLDKKIVVDNKAVQVGAHHCWRNQ